MKNNPQYEAFSGAMNTLLRADPKQVKAAMEADKRERAEESKVTGKRGRGRPPKQSSASSHASSEKD
jgi:hypothetical protein